MFFVEAFSLHTLDKQKVAFTLAEVLITLGIIGMVAAMTMPALLNKTRSKELQTQLKKTYSELNQISQMFYKDYGVSVPVYIDDNSTVWKNFISNIFPKYLKGVQQISDWKYTSVDETGSALSTMPYTLSTLSKYSPAHPICDVSGYQSDLMGRYYLFNDYPASGDNGPVICVDINGKKKPNTYGLDYFLFIFTTDGYVIPMGQEHKNNASSTYYAYNFSNVGAQYCSATSNSMVYNTSCAFYALSNTHPTEKGKDYWKDFVGEVYKR